MKKQIAANISVVLAVALWPVALLGFEWAFGDHEPNISAVTVAGIMMPLAFVFLVTAAWLAGYSYAEAKKRATVSTLSCGAFILALAWLFWK